MKKPGWLQRFATEVGLDHERAKVSVEHEKEEIFGPGIKSGWQLTGVSHYIVKDDVQEWLITVQRMPKKSLGINQS